MKKFPTGYCPVCDAVMMLARLDAPGEPWGCAACGWQRPFRDREEYRERRRRARAKEGGDASGGE